LLSADYAAGLFSGLHCDDALAATGLKTILLHLGALAIALFRDSQNTGAAIEHFHADHRVSRIKTHSQHAVSSAPGRPDLIFFEADGLATECR
jgi:hypothetical protein